MSPLILCIYSTPLLYFMLCSDVFGLPKLTAAAFLAFLASLKNGIPRLPIDRFSIAFGVCLLLSTLFSTHPAISSIGEYRVYTSALLPTVLLGALFYLAAGSKDKADSYANITKHVVYVACISSAWGIFQKAGIYADFPLPGGRVYAGLGSPVYLASFLALAFPLALERKGFAQAALILVGIFLTGTRAGLIAATAGGLYWYGSVHKMNKKMIAGVVAAFLLLFVSMSAMRSALIQADMGRLIVYKMALSMALDNFFFGYGPDLFFDAFMKYRTQEWLSAGFSAQHAQGTAHNDILQALASGGIFYTLAYIAICAAIFSMLSKSGHVGMVASAISLFTYAKLNETALPVKVIFFILAGAAVQKFAKRAIRYHFVSASLCALFLVYFSLFLHDRILFWFRLLESDNLKHLALRFFSIYG